MKGLLEQVHDDEAFYYLGRHGNYNYSCKRKHLFFNEEKGMYDCLPENVIKKKTNEPRFIETFFKAFAEFNKKKD